MTQGYAVHRDCCTEKVEVGLMAHVPFPRPCPNLVGDQDTIIDVRDGQSFALVLACLEMRFAAVGN
jgi:hypothetical protein